MQRTIPAREDLDWLPPSFKALRWTVTGSIWTVAASLCVLPILLARGQFFFFWWKPLLGLFAGGFYTGDRASRAVLRRRMRALASGTVDLSRLRHEADGELVHVTGRVRAGEEVGGVISHRRAVFQRVVFTVDRERWVHESGCDFWVVGADGEAARIEVQDARLVAPEPKLMPEDPTPLLSLLGRTAGPATNAAEVLIQDGDEVDIVGYKTQSVDPTVATLPREIPMRATLRAGKLLPLLIAPAAPGL
jgi:hypothetical protein